MDELVKIKGAWKATVNRADGRVEVTEYSNTIATALKEKIIDAMQDGANVFDFDSIFDLANDEGNAIGYAHTDGIGLYESGSFSSYLAMDCATTSGTGITQPTSTSLKVVGYIATAGTYTAAKLGINASSGSFGTEYASASSWSSITLGAGESMTVEWTISIS